MRFWIKEEGLTSTLFIVPQNDEENERLEEFSHLNEPLTVTMIKLPQYKKRHIIIRKEG